MVPAKWAIQLLSEGLIANSSVPIVITCCLFASIEIAIRNISFMSSAVCDEMEEIRTIYGVVTKLNVLNLKESDVLRCSFWDDVPSTF